MLEGTEDSIICLNHVSHRLYQRALHSLMNCWMKFQDCSLLPVDMEGTTAENILNNKIKKEEILWSVYSKYYVESK